MPPLEMRDWVGPSDTAEFDNPSGTPIYAEFGIPLETMRRCSISAAAAVGCAAITPAKSQASPVCRNRCSQGNDRMVPEQPESGRPELQILSS